MTQSELYTSLHPQERGRKVRYLLRQWRYAEARRLLWREMLRRARGIGRSGQPGPPPPEPVPSRAALQRWLRPGDLVLDAGGAELAWLEAALAHHLADLAPAIVYRADIHRTARCCCHPVETVWLLEQAGYQVWLLTAEGPIARPEDWHAADRPGPWLLAMPPGRTRPEIAP